MSVYFIKGKSTNNVKIGFTRGDPRKRLGNLQTSASEDLELIHVVDSGTKDTETELHKKFCNSRVRGEWFRYDPEISIFLGDLDSRDLFSLFKYRLIGKQMNKHSEVSGWFGDWLLAKAEVCYLRGEDELGEFLQMSKDYVDMTVPPDDWEKEFLIRKKRSQCP